MDTSTATSTSVLGVGSLDAGVVAATLILVQLLKDFIPGRFVPLLALGVGALLDFTFSGFNPQSIVSGILKGAIASGLYDQKKLVSG